MRALVVDDSPDVRALIERSLTYGGMEVDTASSGEDAVVRLRAGETPDVVVLNIQMPGMDGWAVLSVIRSTRSTKDLPVLICTVKQSAADMARAFAGGCDGFLDKPFEVDRLISEVDRITSLSMDERIAYRRLRSATQGGPRTSLP